MKPMVSIFKNNRSYFLSLFLFLVTALCVVAIYGGEAVFFDSHEPHPVWLNISFINYTFMGDGFFALVLAAFYFFYLDKKKTGALLFSSFLLAELIVQLLKNSFNISTFQLFIEQGQYLFLNEKMAVTHEQTFPSGHTAIAFALTTVFERYNINAITAESGKEAIDMINNEELKVEMVLMDIMMPEMDGYETIQKIRREHKNSTLPIIAVTAKAMKGDRQKCIEAGASDYITKPLKIDQLLSLMRVWFYK